MKKIILFTGILFIIGLGGISASAQCDPTTSSFIKCGYYNEAYQDGANDARANRNADFRRYKDKYENKYENNYREGYDAGFQSVRPLIRWTSSQRLAYDSGYSLGQSDRQRANQGRASENSAIGQYDQFIGQYFQQGYSDGFANRPRQYDVPVAGNFPQYPGGGGGGNWGAGTAVWSGSVDDRANLIIHGGTITLQNLSGVGSQTTYQNMLGSLPRRQVVFTAKKSDGRGAVSVIQQPDRLNDFTAIVQIYDKKGGADNYKIDMSWTGGGGGGGIGNTTEEPYSAGSVSWRGRVDDTVSISIYGGQVSSTDVSGGGLLNVQTNVLGFLARRPGTVTVNKVHGRGSVTITQQPSWSNNFTAVVQIYDPKGGMDDYQLDIRW